MAGPTLRIPQVGGALRGQDAVDFARSVRVNQLTDGKLVDVVMSAATTGTARHGLGRAYVGAIVVAVTAAHASAIVAASAATARTNSVDPSTHVYVLTSTAYTGTVTLWVF